MKAPQLYKQLALFGAVANSRSVSANHRALAIAPDHLRACALFGVMKTEANLGVESEIYVDAHDFLQVLKSLPDADFEMTVADSAIRWKCGPAKGHLALMSDDRSKIEIPEPNFEGDISESDVDSDFGVGLELGSLACGSMAMRTLGLQGVQIKNKGKNSYAFATDNTALSACYLGAALPMPESGVVTLLPEAVDLLAAVVKREGSAMIGCDDSSLYCVTGNIELLLNQVPPLKVDVAKILDQFMDDDVKVPLFRDNVAAFLKRAEALADSTQKAFVEISVEQGRTSLVFNEKTGSTEEYYVFPEGPEVNMPPVRLEAARMAKVLQHADSLIFDYAKQNILVLRGKREFVFGITGKREV